MTAQTVCPTFGTSSAISVSGPEITSDSVGGCRSADFTADFTAGFTAGFTADFTADFT